MDIAPRRYTVAEINAIGLALTGNPQNKAIVIAGLLSNPNVLVIPPTPTQRQAR